MAETLRQPARVEAKWQSFEPSRDPLSRVPAVPGLVRTPIEGGDWQEVVALDIAEFLRLIRDDLLEIAIGASGGQSAEWRPASARELEQRVLDEQGNRVALKPGRPRVLSNAKDLQTAPASWGLYRIHRKSDDTWYVGISSNLRRRLGAHRRNGLFDFAAGDKVEIIPAKASDDGAAITWAGLCDAEIAHIARARAQGKKVINITAGGNGQPPQVRFNALRDRLAPPVIQRSHWRNRAQLSTWINVDDQGAEKLGTEHDEVDLRVVWRTPRGDWALFLHPGGHIEAKAEGSGPWHRVGTRTTIDPSWLRDRYSYLFARDLEEDLESLTGPWSIAKDSLDVEFWEPRLPRPDGRGRVNIPPGSLTAMEQAHVRARRLPADLADEGFVVDPTFLVRNSLNAVIRVTAEGRSGVYVKTEENRHAVRAEVIASYLWKDLNWPGMECRALSNGDQNLVFIPDVGAGDIEDLGSFQIYFRRCQDETQNTLHAPRAAALKRIGLRDLRLHETRHVIRFVLLNAVLGNTDRHRGNVHMGWRKGKDGSQGSGFLLPLDHGRCVFNNDPASPGRISGTPLEAITGLIANPHQLLRPLCELIDSDFGATRSTGADWLLKVHSSLRHAVADPVWADYSAELVAIAERTEQLAVGLDEFLDGCSRVVAT